MPLAEALGHQNSGLQKHGEPWEPGSMKARNFTGSLKLYVKKKKNYNNKSISMHEIVMKYFVLVFNYFKKI